MNPNMGLEALTMVVAIYFIIDGIRDVVLSFSLVPIGGGMFMLLGGIISSILRGIILSKWPESSIYFLIIYLGVKLIIDGLMHTFMSNALYKTVRFIC